MLVAYYHDYPQMYRITIDTMKERRDQLDKLYSKVEAFRSCTFAACEDESLSDSVFDEVDRADVRLCKMLEYIEEGIEELDQSIKNFDRMEDSLRFVFEDVNQVIQKGGKV